ncbi:MAG: AAA family ATPase [Chitinophagaceae bacterium]|nr:AAA family ATPase [Chitinophagaceae bacterium]
MLKKIVVIGPESTGKSTLCSQLATHYGTQWCPEYAREYLLKHGMNYTYDDLLTIAKGQLTLEDKLVAESERHSPLTTHHSLLFVDTDMYVMKVWCEFVFDKCHPFILQQIVERKYDLYLLANIDLPWTKDELREYPDLQSRQKLYRMYTDILINQPVPWAEISGSEGQRLDAAIEAVNLLLDGDDE